jgi:hypothetical protein
MRRALIAIVVAAVAACGPSAGQLRLQRVQQSREQARVPGPRQAQEFAVAVHAAHQAGDYKANPQVGAADASEAIAVIDRALPSAGVDAPTLVAWRALMLLDLDRADDALAELERSFALGPNQTAALVLVDVYGGANRPDRVGPICARMVPALRDDDDKLDFIARCRRNMNALSPEGEMAWMSPELIAWYQGENARRLGAEIDAENARAERERYEQSVVRSMEQCSATCKEQGLYCQNDCPRYDQQCDDNCVEINHACLDRCEARARQQLGQ